LNFCKCRRTYDFGSQVALCARPIISKGDFLKLSNFCQKCGKALCICLSLSVGGVVPVIEAVNSPPEECRLSAPCSFGDLWAPHGEEHDYGQPAMAPMAETGGAATSAGPLPPWGWEPASNLPAAYRYPRRSSAAINQPDESAWMGPLIARSISTSSA
jgi:hypothetical protein